MSHPAAGAAPPVSEYRLQRRVQFHEVDSVGIVHFSVFSRYLEEAEHALWRHAGLSIAPRHSDVGFPRVAVAFDFKAPLRFEDEFEIHIWITAIGRRSIRYACRLACRGVEIATGTLAIACIRRGGPDEALQAVPIPDAIASRFVASSEHHA